VKRGAYVFDTSVRGRDYKVETHGFSLICDECLFARARASKMTPKIIDRSRDA
jgi:hypothetical protein